MIRTTLFATALALGASPALAEMAWTLDADASRVAYGSIKAEVFGEVNHFESVSGGLKSDGTAEIAIDLSSVQTNVDIRNERMVEHVFKGAEAPAMLKATIDTAALDALQPGETATVPVEGTLSFLGPDVVVDTDMLVARLGEDRVLVTTNDMIMVAAEDLEIDAGLDTLMELAGLDGITRTVPVTLRLVFDRAAVKEAALRQ